MFVLAMVGMHAFFFYAARGRIVRGDPDFTVFFTAAKILREGRGGQLYNARTQFQVQREFASDTDIRRGPLPYIHPPFEALVFVPLTFLPYTYAFTVWNLLNLCILLAIVRLLKRSVRSLRTFRSGELFLAALAFFPVFASLYQGQDAILLLLVVVLAFRAMERGEDLAAGSWLGLGIFKYHLIVPLFLLLIVGRRLRLLLGFFATTVAAIGVSLLLVGWNGAAEYPGYVWKVITVPGFGQIPFRQMPNLLGLLAGWPRTEESAWVRVVTIALSIGLLAVIAQMRPAPDQSRVWRLTFSCAVIAAVLVAYSSNTYDLCLLVLPVVLVADECSQRPRESRRALIVPAIPLLIAPFWFFVSMRWQRANLIAGFLLWWIYTISRQVHRMITKAEEFKGVSSVA